MHKFKAESISYEINYKELALAEKIGKGGYGVVYKGTYLHSNVAVKQLLMENISQDAADEFASEAVMMAKLRHENIVQFYGYCVSPHYCIVMEYMPHGSLFSVLRSDKPLEWPERFRIAVDIAKGVAVLHHKNILHRDIKSLNVLLDEHNKAKLTDFGLSKVKTETKLHTTKDKNDSVGTTAWMAPELFYPKGRYTQKSDIYSLGITFWELATGKIPFEDAHGERQALIPGWVKAGEREDIPKDCPKPLADLIQICWAQEQEKRPTANEVVTRLKSVTDSLIGCSLRLMVNEDQKFYDNIRAGQEIAILKKTDSEFEVLCRDVQNGNILRFTCSEKLSKELIMLDFSVNNLLPNERNTETVYQLVYKEVTSKGGCTLLIQTNNPTTPVGLSSSNKTTSVSNQPATSGPVYQMHSAISSSGSLVSSGSVSIDSPLSPKDSRADPAAVLKKLKAFFMNDDYEGKEIKDLEMYNQVLEDHNAHLVYAKKKQTHTLFVNDKRLEPDDAIKAITDMMKALKVSDLPGAPAPQQSPQSSPMFPSSPPIAAKPAADNGRGPTIIYSPDFKAKELQKAASFPKVAPQELTAFLRLVSEGEQGKAEAMLKKNSDLALVSGDVTDLSKRTFRNITAFQYALWALDWHMWSMLQRYLSSSSTFEQVQVVKTGSWVEEHGITVSWQKLIDAQEEYIDNCHKWDGKQRKTYWIEQVGRAQLLLPAHVINEYCHPIRSFSPCPDFTNRAWYSLRLLCAENSEFHNAITRGKEIAIIKNGEQFEVLCKSLKNYDIIRFKCSEELRKELVCLDFGVNGSSQILDRTEKTEKVHELVFQEVTSNKGCEGLDCWRTRNTVDGDWFTASYNNNGSLGVGCAIARRQYVNGSWLCDGSGASYERGSGRGSVRLDYVACQSLFVVRQQQRDVLLSTLTSRDQPSSSVTQIL